MPCTRFSYFVSKPKQKLHKPSVPPLSPIQGVINERWLQLYRNICNESGFMGFFPPFLPSPPLLIKVTQMLMTAFPTGRMGQQDVTCNLVVNLGRMHRLCWSLDVPSFG